MYTKCNSIDVAQAIAYAKQGWDYNLYVNVFKRESFFDSNENLGFKDLKIISDNQCLIDNQVARFTVGEIIHDLFSCSFDEAGRNNVTSPPVYKGGDLAFIQRNDREELVFKDKKNVIIYITA